MDFSEISEYQQLSREQLIHSAQEWTPEEWKKRANFLTLEQIPVLTALAAPEHDPTSWKRKLKAFLDGLNDPKKIEALGYACSLSQIQEIMFYNEIAGEPSLQEKLFPIFIGLPHDVFLLLLIEATPKQLLILKKEGLTEPIQHHLTLLVHDLLGRMNQCNTIETSIELGIQNLNLEDIDTKQIRAEEEKIYKLLKSCELIQLTSSKALSLAWNTNRTDLIEKLSKIKEQSQRLISQTIGKERSAAATPTGLFQQLEKRLDSVFSSPSNVEALSDDEPITEALVKFSVWYLNDYYQIGLLPEIQSPDQLELPSQTYSEQDRSDHREFLFTAAQRHLEELGLYTLSDLKQAKIYSKKALKEFIAQHHSKIISTNLR